VRHRRTAILGWLAFVLVSLAIGMNLVPQKQIERGTGGPGESGQAAKAIDGAFEDKASEQVLIQNKEQGVRQPQF
jgi:RND superfamily putative drug exporter